MAQPFWRDVVFITADRSPGVDRTPLTTRAFAVATFVVSASLVAAGFGSPPPPPKASFTQIATFDRAPKPPDCFMPVLHTEPLTNHRRIAIVEAWGAF